MYYADAVRAAPGRRGVPVSKPAGLSSCLAQRTGGRGVPRVGGQGHGRYPDRSGAFARYGVLLLGA
jgi:hypothetical protein